MKHLSASLVVLMLGVTTIASAQLNFSEHIAPIIYENCTSCHRPGNIGPFPLQTYDDVDAYSSLIRVALETGIMPPWPPDTSFQRYAHERLLTQQEKDDIISWIGNGTPQGDPNLAPPIPVFPDGSVLGTPDMQLQIPAYASQAGADDEYKCFYLATNLPTDRKVRAIEIIPGNRAVVHHVLVYAGDANSAPSDSACKTQGLKLMTGYTPGAGPTVFPNGQTVKMGMTLAANSVILLQIHYPAGTIGEVDQTAVNFFFYPENETGVREVSADAILQNWTLFIPANTQKDYTAQYPAGTSVIPVDFSVLSVFPHMHLIGDYIDSYAVTGQNDTVPFARIPHWDFEWQGFYNFKKIVKLPAGSQMFANAHYNNTTTNPHNPNTPPKLVTAGEATTDEMFLVYFHYLPYLPGDENLDLDSLLNVPTSINTGQKQGNAGLSVFPNPATSSVNIQFEVAKEGSQTLDVVSASGQVIVSWNITGWVPGMHELRWDGRDCSGSKVSPGIYFVRHRSPAGLQTIRLAWME
ncbi:MAG: T9SS type A sorting domain-containing protein [Flavobacteriales bacterium]|nr:T9SS type A sorting domain-containing protein [Flavobacteriales bacterium]